MEIGVKNKIFTKTSTSDAHLYSNQDLRKLLVPIIVEQLLSSLMGTADTMMVSNVGSAAISAVSLVDSINILVIQALSALAAGGAIIYHVSDLIACSVLVRIPFNAYIFAFIGKDEISRLLELHFNSGRRGNVF